MADWLFKRVKAALKDAEPNDGTEKQPVLLVLNAKDELDAKARQGQWSPHELAALDGKGKDQARRR